MYIFDKITLLTYLVFLITSESLSFILIDHICNHHLNKVYGFALVTFNHNLLFHARPWDLYSFVCYLTFTVMIAAFPGQ